MFYDRLDEIDLKNIFDGKSDYPRIDERQKWDCISPENREKIIGDANKSMGTVGDWRIMPSTKFMMYKRTGDRAIYESQLFERRNILQKLVLGECVVNDGRYIDDIIDAVMAICEETFWGLPAHNYSPDPIYNCLNPYVDLYVAETAALIAYTGYLLGGNIRKISEAVWLRIGYELEKRVKEPFLARTDYWWMGYSSGTTNNWAPWIISNILIVFFLTETDKLRLEMAAKKCAKILDRFAASYHDDGGCDEGAGYWNEAGGALFDCLDMFRMFSNGKINFFDLPLVKEIGRYIYRAHIDGGYYFNYADCSALPEVDYEMAFRFAKSIGDDDMSEYAAKQFLAEVKAGVSKDRGLRRVLPMLFDKEILRFKESSRKCICEHFMSGIQVMVARECENSLHGFYLSMKGGHNAESHNHNDIGSFIIYYDGQPLVIDLGVEIYRRETFGEMRYTIWTMQSGFHNLPVFNGVEQKNGREFHADNAEYFSGDSEVALSLNIENAYPKEAGIANVRRTAKLNRGKARSVVIHDEVEYVKDKNEISYSFMCACEPIKVGECIVLTQKDGKKIKMAIDSKCELIANIEKIEILDRRLKSVWGEAVWRIIFTGKPKKLCEFSFVFSH